MAQNTSIGTLLLWLLAVMLCQQQRVGAFTTGAPGSEKPAASGLPGTRAPFTEVGTDPDLRAIFLGRCADYKAGKVISTADLEELRVKNCSHLWELFSSAFMHRDACAVNETDYEPFVEAAKITVPVDKANFWDDWDIFNTVRSYSNEGRRSWTLEITLVGYLINNLIFCGEVGGSGVRYDACPAVGECGFGKGSMDAFWGAASTYLAKQANGSVRVFLNSNREGGAFHVNDSFFTTYELMNMRPEAVSRINVYLITMLGENEGDDCNSPSINTMKSIMDARSLPYTCYDQPRDVLHQLCIDDVTRADCVLLQDTNLAPTEYNSPYSTTGAAGSLGRSESLLSLLVATSSLVALTVIEHLQTSHT